MSAEDPTRDTVVQDGSWKFDENVTDAFENMLQRSIPQYDVMRKLVFEIAVPYAKRTTAIVDLGCSRGEALSPFVSKFGVDNRYVGVEVSKPMVAAARARYEGYIKASVVDIREMDLRKEYPPEMASVTLCVLALQFIPIEYRQRIVRNVYDHTISGGTMILVEKILGDSVDLDDLFVDRYLAMKKEHGYSQEQIERKRLSLEGVLVPVTAEWNVQLLRKAGFHAVDSFWRYLNFAGWIAVKG